LPPLLLCRPAPARPALSPSNISASGFLPVGKQPFLSKTSGFGDPPCAGIRVFWAKKFGWIKRIPNLSTSSSAGPAVLTGRPFPPSKWRHWIGKCGLFMCAWNRPKNTSSGSPALLQGQESRIKGSLQSQNLPQSPPSQPWGILPPAPAPPAPANWAWSRPKLLLAAAAPLQNSQG